MFETSQHSNIHFTRVAARDQIEHLRKNQVAFLDCVTGTGDNNQRYILHQSKINVIISTVGMTSQSHNKKGTMELVIPCESFDVVFQDEKTEREWTALNAYPMLFEAFQYCGTIR